MLYSTTWHLLLFKAYAMFKLYKELLHMLVSCFISHFMSLSTTGLILLNLISTFVHHLMKRRVNQRDSFTWRILTEDTQKIIIRSGIRSALRTTTNQHLASPSREGTTLLFPFLILNNLHILCHLTPLMHQHPNLSNL